jgi:hypothetical protein
MPTTDDHGFPIYTDLEPMPDWDVHANTLAAALGEALDDAAQADKDDDSVATVAALPVTGNWLGRRIYVEEDQSLRLCTTLPATFEMIGRIGEWSNYTPAWLGASTNPTIGNGTIVAGYQPLSSNTIAWRLQLVWGSTTNGGSGVWTFGLPSGFMSAPVGEQLMVCKAHIDVEAVDYVGAAYVEDSVTVVRAVLPINATTSAMQPVRNTDATNGVGLGVPAVPGSYTFTDGANLHITGVIEVA